MRNMESRKKKEHKLEDSIPPRTLLFHTLPGGVEAVGSVCSTSFALQILTLNLLSPKPPTFSTAEFKQNPLTSEGLIGEQIFLQDKFAETVKNCLVGPESQESLKWSHWERKVDVKKSVDVILKSYSPVYWYFNIIHLLLQSIEMTHNV